MDQATRVMIGGVTEALASAIAEHGSDMLKCFTARRHGNEPFNVADTTDYIGDGLNRIAMALERIADSLDRRDAASG